jgi:hypothetical protein
MKQPEKREGKPNGESNGRDCRDQESKGLSQTANGEVDILKDALHFCHRRGFIQPSTGISS